MPVSDGRPRELPVTGTYSLHAKYDVFDVVQSKYHATEVSRSQGRVVISFQMSSQLMTLVESEVVIVQKAVVKGVIRDRGRGARRDGDWTIGTDEMCLKEAGYGCCGF